MLPLAVVVKAFYLCWPLKMLQPFSPDESRQGDVCLHDELEKT